MTTTIENWEDQRKCSNLSPAEADALLFPGIDGKKGSRGSPSKTKELCYGCPVRNLCLAQAIQNGWDGNWANTTKKERKEMAKVMHLMVRSVEDVMPDEPVRVNANGKRVSRFLIVKKVVSDYSWMDSAEPSTDELA